MGGGSPLGTAVTTARTSASPHPLLFSVLENQSVFNEVKVPFSLADLPDGESLALHDVDAFIPYLIERWPPNGRPHHIELFEPSGRKPPPGVDGWVVFRLSAPDQEPDGPDARTAINWDAVLEGRLADRPPVPGDDG